MELTNPNNDALYRAQRSNSQYNHHTIQIAPFGYPRTPKIEKFFAKFFLSKNTENFSSKSSTIPQKYFNIDFIYHIYLIISILILNRYCGTFQNSVGFLWDLWNFFFEFQQNTPCSHKFPTLVEL